MSYKRILTIQDISCVGQCSLTVALPIISACGIETCVLPSAVLSTHTGGFTGYTFHDLTEEIPAIQKHWQKENISFDALYSGYLGSAQQVAYVKNLMKTMGNPGSLNIVDPAMADNGTLYPGFDTVYVDEMRKLCTIADIILPNITEACLLTGTDFRAEYDAAYIQNLLNRFAALGMKTVILTGVSYRPGMIGVLVFEDDRQSYYEHRHIANGCHGTGDVYASVFVGALMNGWNAFDSARIAADYTVRCIEYTIDDPSHWYGVKFEKAIPELIQFMYREKDVIV